ncbi:hypothetical protein Fmac_008456 [Flemingia macrophylla]|uniref:Uncharacterized protein n=1 Tax=Flemingia macrophylla TaxID=520843 RepID=A0ABD1MXZ7_9FABA
MTKLGAMSDEVLATSEEALAMKVSPWSSSTSTTVAAVAGGGALEAVMETDIARND